MTRREFMNLEDAMLYHRSHEFEFKVRAAAANAAERSMASGQSYETVFAEPQRAAFYHHADVLPLESSRGYVQVTVDCRGASDLQAATLLAEEQIRRVLRSVPWARFPDLSESR